MGLKYPCMTRAICRNSMCPSPKKEEMSRHRGNFGTLRGWFPSQFWVQVFREEHFGLKQSSCGGIHTREVFSPICLLKTFPPRGGFLPNCVPHSLIFPPFNKTVLVFPSDVSWTIKTKNARVGDCISRNSAPQGGLYVTQYYSPRRCILPRGANKNEKSWRPKYQGLTTYLSYQHTRGGYHTLGVFQPSGATVRDFGNPLLWTHQGDTKPLFLLFPFLEAAEKEYWGCKNHTWGA